MRYYLGIDIGTFESKGVIVDETGRIVASASRPHKMLVPQPGWAEHMPKQDWWADFTFIYKRMIAESGIAVEVSTAGLRKPVGELYPSRPFAEMCVEAGAPFALSSDAHRPEEVAFGYEQAIGFLGDIGVGEICVFEGRRRRLEPLGPPVGED